MDEALRLEQRLWRTTVVDETTGCWVWTGALDRHGYGKIHWGGRTGPTCQVHRLAYRVLHGGLDESLTLDHLCRNTACWRLEHLEQVPQRINNLRGVTNAAAVNRLKYHCPAGHPYSDENTYLRPRAGGLVERECRTCRRERQRAA